jgi:hypothetical protein
MKKFFVFALILGTGWAGYDYASASWNWMRFQNEVDALLQTPNVLNPRNLTTILTAKAETLGFELHPEDIHVRIGATDRDTTISGRVAGRGLQSENRTLRFDLVMSRSVIGREKIYTLERVRTYTARLSPAPRENSDLKGVLD